MPKTRSPRSAKRNLVQEIPKVPTGVAGLDDVLHGGLPRDRTCLINGGPGSGKTILALQFLYNRALAGEPGVLVACEERTDMLRENARSLGWDLAALERKGKLVMVEAQLSPDMVLAGEFNLKGLLTILAGQIKAIGAKHLVIDGIDVMLRIFNDVRRERNELHLLHDALQGHAITSIITAKASVSPGLSQHDWLEYMADCVLLLDHRVIDQVSTRRLRVLKYRGSASGRNEYPYVLGREGMRMIPVSSAHLLFKAPGRSMSSGAPSLDGILAGGMRKGTSIMISGASGTGKTTLACTFAQAAATRGERTLYVNFEESEQALISHMRSPGIDLRSAVEKGRLHILAILPESRGVEEHLIDVLDTMDRVRPQHLVFDAVSATARMGSTLAAFDYAMRLLSACRERDITCIFTKQLHGHDDELAVTGHGLSSLVDTIIFLRFARMDTRLDRLITVVKSRGRAHSNEFHRLRISSRGISVEDARRLNGDDVAVLPGSNEPLRTKKRRP